MWLTRQLRRDGETVEGDELQQGEGLAERAPIEGQGEHLQICKEAISGYSVLSRQNVVNAVHKGGPVERRVLAGPLANCKQWLRVEGMAMRTGVSACMHWLFESSDTIEVFECVERDRAMKRVGKDGEGAGCHLEVAQPCEEQQVARMGDELLPPVEQQGH